jgi:thiol:disulfide interchange protein
MERYRVQGVPTSLLLGADGQERRRFVGFVSAEQMREAMEAVAPPDASRG